MERNPIGSTSGPARNYLAELFESRDYTEIESFLEQTNPDSVNSGQLRYYYDVIFKKTKKVKFDCNTLDIVGTGGDGQGTINASSAAAIVVSACGIKVAKHGNRAISSNCGSADLFEALGYNFPRNEEEARRSMEKTGFVFFLAPYFNSYFVDPKLKEIRRKISIKSREEGKPGRTVFNLLGPLCNPAEPEYRMIGVYNEQLGPVFRDVLYDLGVKKPIVVHGGGLDEVAIHDETNIWSMKEGNEMKNTIYPLMYEKYNATLKQLKGDSPKANAKELIEIFNNKLRGAKRSFIVMNAAMAINATRNNKSLSNSLREAEEVIESGKAARKLEKIISFSK